VDSLPGNFRAFTEYSLISHASSVVLVCTSVSPDLAVVATGYAGTDALTAKCMTHTLRIGRLKLG